MRKNVLVNSEEDEKVAEMIVSIAAAVVNTRESLGLDTAVVHNVYSDSLTQDKHHKNINLFQNNPIFYYSMLTLATLRTH